MSRQRGRKPETRRAVRQYVRDACLEWLLLDNVLCVWRKSEPRPVVFPIESTEYSDVFGIERLTILYGIKSEELKQVRALTKAEMQALSTSTKTLIDPRITREDPRQVLPMNSYRAHNGESEAPPPPPA